MIILEGPDNSGKTTLANKISARFNHPVYHAGGPPANKDEAYKRLSDTLNKSLIDEFSLHDRHILFGENIYGKMAGRVPYVPWEEHIEYLMEFNPLIIYCRPPIDDLLTLNDADFRAGEAESHKEFIRENCAKIISAYDLLMTQVPHVVWNFKGNSTIPEPIIINMCRGFLPDPILEE